MNNSFEARKCLICSGNLVHICRHDEPGNLPTSLKLFREDLINFFVTYVPSYSAMKKI